MQKSSGDILIKLYFVFHARKKVIRVWKEISVSHNDKIHIYECTIPLNSESSSAEVLSCETSN